MSKPKKALNPDAVLAPKSKSRRLFVIIAMIAVVLSFALFATHEYNSAFRSLENFSVIWLAHDMLAIHMSKNRGHWPADWDALHPAFAMANGGYGAPDIAWVKERIAIDFDVDSTTLSAANDPADHKLHAICMSDGTQNGETRAANARLKSAMLRRNARESKTKEGT